MTSRSAKYNRERVIRASELGAFSYCAHAWWLRSIEGVRPENTHQLDAGAAAHEHHGRGVILGAVMTRAGYLLLLLSGMAGLGWLIQLLTG